MQCRDQRRNRRIISKSPADVNIAIDIPRSKHETSTQLKRILSHATLPMTRCPRPLARRYIFLAENM